VHIGNAIRCTGLQVLQKTLSMLPEVGYLPSLTRCIFCQASRPSEGTLSSIRFLRSN
jgi:hypothetical protein